LLLIMYDVNKASTKNIADIVKLTNSLEGKVEMMALTSSGATDFETFRHEHQLAVPYYFADATVLKTIIRSNPGITLWIDGTAAAQRHHNDTPAADDILVIIASHK